VKDVAGQKTTSYEVGRGDYLGIPDPFARFRAPYPDHCTRKAFLADGSLVTIRAIKAEDAPLLVTFFNTLSPDTVFFRFLAHLRALPHEWVRHFTVIEYDRDVALVATRKDETGEHIVGVGRVMRHTGSTDGELAVVVADDQQGRGLGKILVEDCVRHSAELGMRRIWGVISRDNARALAMAEKLGFSIILEARGDLYEVERRLPPAG
jgi:acetyltransferase